MENEMKKEEKKDSGHGFGLALIAAAAAAGYFLYGSKEGAKNRKKVKGWMLKAKGEVLEQIEKLKNVNEEDYNKIIDKVSEKYSKVKNIDGEEVRSMMEDMRKHWRKIQNDIEPRAKKDTKNGKKIATLSKNETIMPSLLIGCEAENMPINRVIFLPFLTCYLLKLDSTCGT